MAYSSLYNTNRTRLDASPQSEAVFAEFVDAGGYQRREGWSGEGWA